MTTVSDWSNYLRSILVHLNVIRPAPTFSASYLKQGFFATVLGWQWPQLNPFIRFGTDDSSGGAGLMATYEELGLLTMLFNPPLPAAVAWIPFTFRMLSLIISLPLVIVVALDFVGYLLFRLLDEPWGWTRTAYYKSATHRALFRRKSKVYTNADSSEVHSSASSPELQTIPLPSSASSSFSSSNNPFLHPHSSFSSSPVSRRAPYQSPDDADDPSWAQKEKTQRSRRAMMSRARASSVGVDGPMMSDLRSPSPEVEKGNSLLDLPEVEELR